MRLQGAKPDQQDNKAVRHIYITMRLAKLFTN